MRRITIVDKWQDAEFGTIYLKINTRCRRLNARCYEDGLLVTIPTGYSRALVTDALERMHPQLLTLVKRNELKRPEVRLIDWDFKLVTDSFRLYLKPSGDNNFYIHHESSQEAWLLCPQDTDFATKQTFLTKSIEECLKQHAKGYFSGLLRQLVHQHQFSVSGLKIRNMNTRWGSCSAEKEIHLSIFVMLLPLHLQHLIVLHELCHTVHMNHGPKFHELLNRVTDGNEAQWNKELKNYRTDILSFGS